jgi:ribosomal protein L11 methylase PrmA
MTGNEARLTAHPASFRDPTGRVYFFEDRIFRRISGKGIDHYKFVRQTGLLTRLAARGKIVATREVEASDFRFSDCAILGDELVLEHEIIPFVSYPYEWPFRALQRAALLHLDLHLEALEAGITLSDATAYNIQFVGPNPIFIDISSFVPYEEGGFWLGHRQFCEQFLNPLLLQASTGVPYQPWYRGTLDGNSSQHLAKVLPWRSKFDWKVFSHVTLPNRFQRSAASKSSGELQSVADNRRTLSRAAFVGLLEQLRSWIAGLRPAGISHTTWSEYEAERTYNDAQQAERLNFVSSFVADSKPNILWDLGCNAGEFSLAALEAGAGTCIGFDFDQGALAAAFDRAEHTGVRFLPLWLDAANPSPSQGWREQERQSLQGRAGADAVIAMAFEHHLTIGRNVPIGDFLDWLLSLAPSGIVEFVDKRDSQVRRMLALREDIFPDYSIESFTAGLAARATILNTRRIADSERHLFSYQR